MDADATRIEFVGDSEYTRKVFRGQSTMFECLDQQDVVLQANPAYERLSYQVIVSSYYSSIIICPTCHVL